MARKGNEPMNEPDARSYGEESEMPMRMKGRKKSRHSKRKGRRRGKR